MGKKLEEHYLLLDQYTEEATAGATDDWLHSMTEVPHNVISKWRVARGLKRIAAPQETIDAIQNLAQTYTPSMHTVGSVFGGLWQPPRYVLRRPLDYTLLCRAVHHLLYDLGLGGEQVAAALGIREHDVAMASQAWVAYLKRKGRKCIACEAIVDPKNGPYCTKRCEDDSSAEAK